MKLIILSMFLMFICPPTFGQVLLNNSLWQNAIFLPSVITPPPAGGHLTFQGQKLTFQGQFLTFRGD